MIEYFIILKIFNRKKDNFIRIKDQSPDIRKKEIIESLVRYFGKEAADYLEYAEKNWAEEEYLGGELIFVF